VIHVEITRNKADIEMLEVDASKAMESQTLAYHQKFTLVVFLSMQVEIGQVEVEHTKEPLITSKSFQDPAESAGQRSIDARTRPSTRESLNKWLRKLSAKRR
jgi:hypothetical protein